MKKSGSASASSAKALHSGHRSRVRERFARNGFAGMVDYEVLEALLIQILPRRDVKPLAKALLEKFKTVSETLNQPLEILSNFPGLARNSAIGLKMFGEIGSYCLHEKCCRQGNLLDSSELIINYARMKLGLRKHECYMALFLDSHHRLIEQQLIAEGTVSYIFAYVRNIVESAMLIGASGVIIVHNHPSGKCHPTTQDIEATIEIYNSFKSIDVTLLDHLIVSHDECFSFVAHGIDFSTLEKELKK